MKTRRILFVLNPISGLKRNRKSIEDIIRKQFEKQSTIDYSVKYTGYPGHAVKIAEEAVKQNYDAVIAVGGDGTMNEVASGLVNSNTALGLIPRGSGNGYARSLRIPLNIFKAIETVKYGKIRKVDVGKIDQSYFFGVTGVGFDAFIGAQFQSFGMRGPLPYFYIGVREYFRYYYEAFTLKFNGRELTFRPLLITVANTPQYGMSALIAPGAKVDDGVLEICIIDRISTLKAVTQLHHLFNGTIDKVSAYKRFSASELIIEREHDKGLFHTDGEPKMGPKELKISVLPRALKVIVPAEET
ncbi:MAG: diacylglycerol kinase family lipid kinase [Calditrichaeota bacterium]|nr:diacylglycerol kinase family lipid kinase [Calditrichota bacterium]